MKGFITPGSTPYTLSTGLNTPSAPGPSHYFAPSHREDNTQNPAYPQILDDYDFLDAKLASLESPRSSSSIDAIPNEILALILEQGYFDAGRGLPDSSFRSLTSQISRRFRNLTLHIPSLWSVIYLSPSNVFEGIEVLPVHLQRSKDHLLDIQLSCFWASDLTESVMDLLVAHSQRWRQLAITTMNDYIFSFIEHVPAPFLQYLTISHYANQRRVALPPSLFDNHLPRLEYLCLRNVNIDNIEFSLRNLETLEIRGYGVWPNFAKLNDMLGGSMSLKRLILHVKPADVLQQVHEGRSGQQLLLPELHTMEVHTSEWLTEDQTALIRLFAYPKLQSLAVRESVSAPTEAAHTIMNYTAFGPGSNGSRPEPSLFVQAADFALAYLAAPAPSNIMTLELRKFVWPTLPQLRQAFGALHGLRRLVVSELDPRRALLTIIDGFGLPARELEARMHEAESSVAIPSLRSLVLGIYTQPYCSSDSPFNLKEYTGPFLRLFSLPYLASVHFQGLTLPEWRSVAQTFGGTHAEAYPALATLALSDMTDIVPTDPRDSVYVDSSGSFPSVQHLQLARVCSNGFVSHLLPRASSQTHQWPHLRTLAISGDANASLPLLHRVITAREAMGGPLEKLCLDGHFFRNGESVQWMRERLDVVRVEENGKTILI